MTKMDIALSGRPASSGKAGDIKQATGSSFLDTLTLSSILAPITEAEFLSHYWQKKPLIVHREKPDFYGDLFTLQDFDETIMRAPDYVKMADATIKKQIRHHGTAPQSRENVLSDMRDGATLILDSVQQYNLNLGLLCRKLSQEMNCHFQTNLYLTPPNGKGFLPHWDCHDVFVFQVVGSKHWKIEKNRRDVPERGSTIADEEREFRGEVISIPMKQGDLIYIPRGYVHAAECGTENSLHITLGIHPNMMHELLSAVVKAAALHDDNVRMALPMAFLTKGRDEILNRAADALRKMADREFLDQVLNQYRNESVKKFPLDVSGQILSHFQPVTLKLADQVAPRSGTIYRIDSGKDTVTVYIGTRAVTFPDFFAEALHFALNTPHYAIRDLPGELEDEERVVFIERLMLEGLVVRK